MAREGSDPAAKGDGDPIRHIPVLLCEVVNAVQPAPGQVILDGTFGAGGYARAFLQAGANVIALDRDPVALAIGRALEDEHAPHLRVIEARFSSLDQFSPADGLDAVVLDIGVSSMQVDEAERGFSFRHEGPLDMRMSGKGVSAADVVNQARPGDLARIFGFLGEERQAGRIARAIERRRIDEPFRTTRDLAGLIELTVKRKPTDRIHPATKVFQALRAYVNDELGELARALLAAERALKPGGRLAVVTFHSLEDRIVKRFVQARSGKSAGSRHLPEVARKPATFTPARPAMVSAGAAEIRRNPRARSAKLRLACRTAEPVAADAGSPADMALFGLPDLPRLSVFGGQSDATPR